MAWGACEGAASELEELWELGELAWWTAFTLVGLEECDPVVLSVLPGNACAATSESAPVSATEPAIIQRVASDRRRTAESRVLVVWGRIR